VFAKHVQSELNAVVDKPSQAFLSWLSSHDIHQEYYKHVRTLNIAPLLDNLITEEYGTRYQWITLFHLQTHEFIHEWNEPAEAGPHLPTPEGWKAESTWLAGYIQMVYPFKY